MGEGADTLVWAEERAIEKERVGVGCAGGKGLTTHEQWMIKIEQGD